MSSKLKIIQFKSEHEVLNLALTFPLARIDSAGLQNHVPMEYICTAYCGSKESPLYEASFNAQCPRGEESKH